MSCSLWAMVTYVYSDRWTQAIDRDRSDSSDPKVSRYAHNLKPDIDVDGRQWCPENIHNDGIRWPKRSDYDQQWLACLLTFQYSPDRYWTWLKIQTATAAVGGKQNGQHWPFFNTGLEQDKFRSHICEKHSLRPFPPRGQRQDLQSSCFHSSPGCLIIPLSSTQISLSSSSSSIRETAFDGGRIVVGGHTGQHRDAS